MKKLLLVAMAAAVFSLGVYSQSWDLEAEGRGPTEFEASQQALMNLAKQLQVKVTTYTGGAEIVSEGSGGGTNEAMLVTDALITTDTVLAGVRYKTIIPADKSQPYAVLAYMRFAESRPLYLRKIVDLTAEMGAVLKQDITGYDADDTERYLAYLGVLLDEYKTYTAMVGLMGIAAGEVPPAPYTRAALQKMASAVAQRCDTLDRCARLAAKAMSISLSQTKIIVAYPTPNGGSQKSDSFGMAFMGRLTGSLVKNGAWVQDDPKGATIQIKTVYDTAGFSRPDGYVVIGIQALTMGAKDAGRILASLSYRLPAAAAGDYFHE